jgi:hypothetical protein
VPTPWPALLSSLRRCRSRFASPAVALTKEREEEHAPRRSRDLHAGNDACALHLIMLRLPNDEEDEWERAAAAVALATARPRPSPAASSGGDEVAAAFGSLRIMPPPPPADNGGAFERPSNGEGVSAATASAVASQLDPVLVSCLENPRERLSMLQFEDQIVRFVKNPRCVRAQRP